MGWGVFRLTWTVRGSKLRLGKFRCLYKNRRSEQGGSSGVKLSSLWVRVLH